MTDPWELVLENERSVADAERHARGAFYTPRSVVEEIAALAVTPQRVPDAIVDPTCGAGAFLLGALDRLVALGHSADAAIEKVWGIDIDPGAVTAARSALDAWAAAHGCEVDDLDRRVVCGDGQALDAFGGREALCGGRAKNERFVLVIGNPPFATPLKGLELPPRAQDFRRSHDDLLGPYADLAAVHLAAALKSCEDGDRVVMVLPQSLVSSRDVAGLRDWSAGAAPASVAWATSETVFDANVRVWAPVLDVGGPVTREGGWATLLADALGAPAVELSGEALGDRIEATAGFRDEYYGLAEACRELRDMEAAADSVDADRHRLVTVGSLDPLWSWWGHRPITFAKRKWAAPVIDRQALDGKVGRWFDRQRGPKILLPTQSKVFEPVVDSDGSLVPVTPLISIRIDDGAAVLDDGGPLTLEMVAALLLAPPLVAWAHRRWFGAALSVSAIKVPAKAVAALPMPRDLEAWRTAGSLVSNTAGTLVSNTAGSLVGDTAGSLVGDTAESQATVRANVMAIARTMMDAYDADVSNVERTALFDWWLERLPAIMS